VCRAYLLVSHSETSPAINTSLKFYVPSIPTCISLPVKEEASRRLKEQESWPISEERETVGKAILKEDCPYRLKSGGKIVYL
jgi:hypothetical protein